MGILTFCKIQYVGYQTLVSLEFHEILEFDEYESVVTGSFAMCFLKLKLDKYDSF